MSNPCVTGLLPAVRPSAAGMRLQTTTLDIFKLNTINDGVWMMERVGPRLKCLRVSTRLVDHLDPLPYTSIVHIADDHMILKH